MHAAVRLAAAAPPVPPLPLGASASSLLRRSIVAQVKKKFIDKKNATTYNLVFRSTEVRSVHRVLATAGPRRVLLERLQGQATFSSC